MRLRLISMIALGVFSVLPMASQADTVVAGYGIPPIGSSSCSWQLTSSSGGGYAPQFYTLNCSGAANVVSMMTVGGACNTTSGPKSGYRLQGSGCSTQVLRVETTTAQPVQCTSANKGATYFSGPTVTANSILQTNSAANFCGDCKVVLTSASTGSTISCSTYKN